MRDLGPYALLIPVLTVLITGNMAAQYTLSWHKAFGVSARAAVISAAVGNCLKMQ